MLVVSIAWITLDLTSDRLLYEDFFYYLQGDNVVPAAGTCYPRGQVASRLFRCRARPRRSAVVAQSREEPPRLFDTGNVQNPFGVAPVLAD